MRRKGIGAEVEPHADVDVVEVNTNSKYADLQHEIARAYQGDVTISDAEKLAAKFLLAQMEVADELSQYDLDARMKKNGVKAKRAMVYMEAATRSDKKPSDTLLEHHVAMDPGVQLAQNTYEESDAKRESLSLYLGIFKDAHIYFRGISKGRYE